MVRVSGFYEERVENMSTWWRKEMRLSPAVATGSIPKANTADPTHKESSISGAD